MPTTCTTRTTTNRTGIRMIATRRAAQLVLTIGLIVGGGATCFAQSNSPTPMPDRTQEVGPPTDERVTPERGMPRERLAERTLVRERVVERRQEGEIYVGGFGASRGGTNLIVPRAPARSKG